MGFYTEEIMQYVLTIAKNYAFARLKEPSTWRGIICMLTSLGITLSPDQINALVAVGLCATGAVGAFFPDPKQEAQKDNSK